MPRLKDNDQQERAAFEFKQLRCETAKRAPEPRIIGVALLLAQVAE
jgi:hypothetical protein